MLDGIIKKLSLILILCGGIACVIYFTDIGAILKGEAKKKVEKKVEEFKKDVKEKLDEKKEKVEKEVEKVEKKIEDNKEKVNDIKDKAKDLKKIKLRDLLD